MTDVTATQVATHSVRIPALRTLALVLGRSLGRLSKACGRGLIDASGACARAHELAYVKTGCATVERRRLALDADSDGRDPSW